MVPSPHLKQQWVIPPDANAAFVAAMEDILEVYQRPYDPQRPLVCLDETSKQLIDETRVPIAAKPGQPGRRNAPVDFRGQKRSNATHRSTTDPDARLYRKGPGMEARLCYIGHGLMENRSGLWWTLVSGHVERLAALDMIEPVADRPKAVTLGADKSYDAADFVEELRPLNVRPHVAQNLSGRRSAIDKRTTRHSGYAKSQRARKRIEEAFGWIKTVAGLECSPHRKSSEACAIRTIRSRCSRVVRTE